MAIREEVRGVLLPYLLDTYWTRLRALDYRFLREAPDAAVATALRFTLIAPGVHNAIVGTTRPERWQRNAALPEDGALPAAEFKQIRALARGRPTLVGCQGDD